MGRQTTLIYQHGYIDELIFICEKCKNDYDYDYDCIDCNKLNNNFNKLYDKMIFWYYDGSSFLPKNCKINDTGDIINKIITRNHTNEPSSQLYLQHYNSWHDADIDKTIINEQSINEITEFIKFVIKFSNVDKISLKYVINDDLSGGQFLYVLRIMGQNNEVAFTIERLNFDNSFSTNRISLNY